MKITKRRYYSSSELEKIIKPSLDFLKVSVIGLSSANKFKLLKSLIVFLYEKARQNFKCFKEFEGYEYNHDAPVITYNNLKYFITILVLDIICRGGGKVKNEEQKKKIISEVSDVLYDLLDDAGVMKIAEKDKSLESVLTNLEMEVSKIADEIILVE
ncbi:MAG: hypothetical protein NZZ41_07195 [Candidatus Dojkabacteria bacterium]|nr:hypothetical protein [Candidatus Dojkabacteria bacterium]